MCVWVESVECQACALTIWLGYLWIDSFPLWVYLSSPHPTSLQIPRICFYSFFFVLLSSLFSFFNVCHNIRQYYYGVWFIIWLERSASSKFVFFPLFSLWVTLANTSSFNKMFFFLDQIHLIQFNHCLFVRLNGFFFLSHTQYGWPKLCHSFIYLCVCDGIINTSLA